MKIAVVTAIFGGKDTQKPFPPQSVECDYYCFTEENTPVPLPNLPDRLKAKYFKLQMEKFIPWYDTYVWIDGNIEVKSPDFVKKMTENIPFSPIVIQRHHERQTIKEEIDFILSSENEYLTTRYGKQPLKQEYEYYLKEGMPKNAPLYSCNIFAYNARGNGASFFMAYWWRLCLHWSWFDQSAFSYLAWMHNQDYDKYKKIYKKQGRKYQGNPVVNVINLGPMFDNPYFTLHPHTKPLG